MELIRGPFAKFKTSTVTPFGVHLKTNAQALKIRSGKTAN